MLGCLATAESSTDIRTDLDNELEAADFYSFETIQAALHASEKTGMSRHEVEQLQKASDEAEQPKVEEKATKVDDKSTVRIPPKTAIAHTLIRAWVEQKEAELQSAKM